MNNLKKLFINIGISLGVGIVSAILTNNNIYDAINIPFFALPSYFFPIIWTILYVLMGISSYLVSEENNKEKKDAIFIYCLQLFFNFFWSIIFFNIRNFLLAFVWLILLLILIIVMIYKFYNINKTAAYLNILYLIWVIFAGVLNLSIVILN